MKAKKHEIITTALFLGFLFAMMLGYFISPSVDFSEREKRYLADMPLLTADSVASGDWGADVETYMADHIPCRDFFVGLNAYFDLFTGRQVSKDIRVEDGRLLEAPVEEEKAAIARNMTAINGFADIVGQPVDLMIVPSAGWAAELPEYPDSSVIDSIYNAASSSVTPIDVRPVFQGMPGYYYRTDHHWTSQGAHAAYVAYMKASGREYAMAEDFEIEVQSGFQGSTYSRSALWLTKAEDLELWHGSNALTVENGETEGLHNGVFYYDRLKEVDKYTVYLDGNHSIVRIHNPEKDGKLLVIRDSYSNSLGCFLAESYGEVVLVDLRYYKQTISQLAKDEQFDNILVCYSIGNFLTDANFIWLR